MLFDCRPAVKVTLQVLDDDGNADDGGVRVQGFKGHVYPSQAKRLAPDFVFHEQVYRADGESILLPPGKYNVTYTPRARVPRLKRQDDRRRRRRHARGDFELQRWIKLADHGWYSGDHHIHAAGCAHYESPTEGVDAGGHDAPHARRRPQRRLRAVLGALLVPPEAVLRGQGQPALPAAKPHAVRRRGLRLPARTRGTCACCG